MLVAVWAVVSCHPGGTTAESRPSQPNALDDQPLPLRPAPPFSFVVAGHVYGSPGAGRPRPSSTLVDGAALLDDSSPDFSVLLGDTVFGWHPDLLGGTLPFLRTQMPGPVFNVVGNHELGDPTLNNLVFGARWHAFEHGRCRMVVLDSESDPWLISGQQQAFLLAEIDRALQQQPPPQAFFVFSHKPVWAMTMDTVLTAVLGNDQVGLPALIVGHDGPSSFARIVLPRLRELAAHVPVCCFAGDVGAFPPANMHLFGQRDGLQPALRYFAVGLGDDPRDAFLTVEVRSGGEPLVRAHELKTGRLLPMELYDHESWRMRWFPDGLPEPIVTILTR